MINYIEKGNGLHEAIFLEGHQLVQKDGVWISSDDIEVQSIINSYDPLPELKTEAISRIKQHAATLVHAIYPHVDAETTDVIGFYNYTVDMWQGGALPARLQSLKTVRDTALIKISEVSAMTDWQLVDTHDATVGW